MEPNTMRMRLLYVCIVSHVLSALTWAAPASESDSLRQESPFIKEVLRQAKVAEIKSFMDTTVDPCVDFYDFACGNYKHINSASVLHVASTDLFNDLRKSFHRKVMNMLNKKHDKDDMPEDIQVKHFYAACKRMKELTAAYPDKLKKLIAEFGTMPVLEGSAWRESDFDWLGTIARISHRYGIETIIRVVVITDYADNQRNRVFLGRQNFPLESRAMYEGDATRNYRENLRYGMQRILQRFLLVAEELAKQTAQELLDFEVDLAKGLLDDSLGLGLIDLAELLTVEEVHRRYAPTLDIDRFVSVVLGEQITDEIYEYNSLYQQNLVKVIKRTPLRTVANYIFYSLIYKFVEMPSSTPKEQEQNCVDLTQNVFDKNLDNMFYRRYNNEKSTRDIDTMWRELKATFNESLSSSPQLNWIARPTRDLAMAKLQAMTLEVNSYANKNFTQDFAGLNLQSSDYVENLRQTQMIVARRTREMLHQQAKEEEDALLSFTPSYVLVENIIKLPVAMLQPFYIWADAYPKAVLFGKLGSLIGHELFHGFDDDGRKFDAQANRRDWWDKSSSTNFLERRQCFTKQYGKYMYDGIPLKESTKQSENIADNGGTRLAYAAYQKWYDAQLARAGGSQELATEQLPTLNYTGKQLFFISFAQSWCNDMDPRLKTLQVSTDEHVPGKFRVIGTVSNSGEFSKEFNCPAGSPMNPKDKCFLY